MEKNDYRLAFLEAPCFYCRHLRHIGTQEGLEGWTCAAFPSEILFTILTRDLSHDEVLPGQEGDFVFESKIYPFDDGPHRITFDGDWEKVGE
jgi:hypothetical protein